MIESSYALSKFIAAVSKAYSEFEVGDTDFLWNIETGLAFKNLDSMVQVATQSRVLKGIVFGRNDYCGSIGQDSSFVNHESITADGVKMAQKCRESDLDLVVGGGVSIDSIPALNELDRFRLTRFETRKVIFSSEALKIEKLEEGMILALKFELMWLTNKRDYYSAIYNEDQKRFEALTTRWGINP
jgi:hypothetical protein